MKIFDFFYYCLYRMFKLVKREGVKDENLAVNYYPILLWTNTIMLAFPIRFFLPRDLFNPPVLNYSMKCLFVLIFIGWYLWCRNYFMKSGRSNKIINHYNSLDSKKYAVFGITYSLATFASFISIAIWVSRG